MRAVNKLKVLVIFICACAAFAVYLVVQNNWIQVEDFEVELSNLPQAFDNFKIVQVSDVHLPRNASNIQKLIDLVKKQAPDIVAVTGDMIDQSADISSCGLERFCRGLADICDVYAVTGNHEFWNGDRENWKKIIDESGIKLIDNEYAILEKDGQKLALMGLEDNRQYSDTPFGEMDELKDVPKVLLAHRPELWPAYSSGLYGIHPDLVLSGHAHGGQFRIPFAGGLYAPGQGFFPQYTSGLYETQSGSRMIVSRGLGNSVIPVRINNRPHLPVIKLKCK